MSQAAQQKRQTDHAVKHDHQHGEHGVSCQRGVVAAGQHDRRDHGDDDGSCTTADLVEGAVVREAELDLTADGLVFEEIELR